ncbi:hypothetical protein ACLBWZ_10850 [Brucellaceae bacterium C25G]
MSNIVDIKNLHRSFGGSADLVSKIGENNAVPTTAVSEADIDQMKAVAQWYVDSALIPSHP